MNKKNLSALIGLVGAIYNNGKTEYTDVILRKALLNESDDNLVDEIHEEKFKISPNCATCQTPCGNTSDYPLKSFDEWPKEQKILKEQIMDEILRIIKKEGADLEIPDIVLKGIAYMGYNLEAESYKRILQEMSAW